MGLFTQDQMAEITKIAEKSKQLAAPVKQHGFHKNITARLEQISQVVIDYFKGSEAVCIRDRRTLHDYVTDMIDVGIGGIDTETTGLDRRDDKVVGASLYFPGGVECYIPSKHIIPIMDEPYKDQLDYREVQEEFDRFRQKGTRLIFANADFDLSMMFYSYGVDLIDQMYYDVQTAWRCIRENEPDNALKVLYNKYVLRGHGDPKKFSDFFPPDLYPYSDPEVAKLYAANDAKITYELYKWQLPLITKGHPACEKRRLEAIADLVWGVEFPVERIAQRMHRCGLFIEQPVADHLREKYHAVRDEEMAKMRKMVAEAIADPKYHPKKRRPFNTAEDFNPKSDPHVKWLVTDLLGYQTENGKTDKVALGKLNQPITNEILKCRSVCTIISSFVDKLPDAVWKDDCIHGTFKTIGADTGRFSSAEPNLQNIPSKMSDIRHMFRAHSGCVLLSSDFSQQEPKLVAFICQDENMIRAYKENKDIYSFIASIAFNKTYEECLENLPTGEYDEFGEPVKIYQPDGKARRAAAKVVVLGILYGMSVPSIADSLYAKEDWPTEKKVKQAQFVYDSVLSAFPALRKFMENAHSFAKKYGYTETILGRRRHHPNFCLPRFEFVPKEGYVSPDIDPLNPETFDAKPGIPDRILDSLRKEFSKYKYFSQIVRRTKELEEQNIRVINNSKKVQDAERQIVNSIIQGSAADTTKLALLKVATNERMHEIGARVVNQIHDELLVECPIENYKECAELLAKLMCEAAGFLSFPIKCDVTVSYRWNGLSYPCPYTEPKTVDTVEEDEIKWIQYHLCEAGYYLPVFKKPNGDKPEGDAAVGVNGRITDDYTSCIEKYKQQYGITDDEFIQHIHTLVHTGTALGSEVA